METLQHTWISGNVPRNILQENTKNYIACRLPADPKDGFIHLLGKGLYLFPTICSFSFSISAPHLFLYLYEGEMSLTCGTDTWQLSSGDALFLAINGEIAMQMLKGRCKYFKMYLDGLPLVSYERLLSSPLHYPSKSSGVFDLFRELSHLQELSFDADLDSLFACRTNMWITNILSEMSIFAAQPIRHRESIPSYLEEIRNRFDTQFQESYTLDDLENQYTVSKYRICREFSRYFGSSPVQYLNHRRMEEAKKLLLTTDETIHEIGTMVGIPNTNHFINLFKRETGATPLAFKQDAPVSISELHYL